VVSTLTVVAFFFLVHSCAIYEPQPVSIPLMQEKNELQLSGGVSMLAGISGSVAFAPAQHVALQVYASAYPENTNFQGSIGYFTKTKTNLNFEIYAGIGNGIGTKITDDSSSTYHNADNLIYFVQSNIGQTNLGRAHIDYGFGLKTGYFEAKVKEALFDNITPYTTNGFLIEPQAFMRMGSERLKVGFQLNGTRIFLDKEKKDFSDFYNRLNFCVSINYRIAPSLRKK
jgi:hypothetical protein